LAASRWNRRSREPTPPPPPLRSTTTILPIPRLLRAFFSRVVCDSSSRPPPTHPSTHPPRCPSIYFSVIYWLQNKFFFHPFIEYYLKQNRNRSIRRIFFLTRPIYPQQQHKTRNKTFFLLFSSLVSSYTRTALVMKETQTSKKKRNCKKNWHTPLANGVCSIFCATPPFLFPSLCFSIFFLEFLVGFLLSRSLYFSFFSFLLSVSLSPISCVCVCVCASACVFVRLWNEVYVASRRIAKLRIARLGPVEPHSAGAVLCVGFWNEGSHGTRRNQLPPPTPQPHATITIG